MTTLTKSDKTALSIMLILLVPVAMAFRGWVLAKLWLWFAVPLGAPMIGTAEALGLVCIFGVVEGAKPSQPKSTVDAGTADRIAQALASAFVFPAFMLLFGWAIQAFT